MTFHDVTARSKLCSDKRLLIELTFWSKMLSGSRYLQGILEDSLFAGSYFINVSNHCFCGRFEICLFSYNKMFIRVMHDMFNSVLNIVRFIILFKNFRYSGLHFIRRACTVSWRSPHIIVLTGFITRWYSAVMWHSFNSVPL